MRWELGEVRDAAACVGGGRGEGGRLTADLRMELDLERQEDIKHVGMKN